MIKAINHLLKSVITPQFSKIKEIDPSKEYSESELLLLRKMLQKEFADRRSLIKAFREEVKKPGFLKKISDFDPSRWKNFKIATQLPSFYHPKVVSEYSNLEMKILEKIIEFTHEEVSREKITDLMDLLRGHDLKNLRFLDVAPSIYTMQDLSKRGYRKKSLILPPTQQKPSKLPLNITFSTTRGKLQNDLKDFANLLSDSSEAITLAFDEEYIFSAIEFTENFRNDLAQKLAVSKKRMMTQLECLEDDFSLLLFVYYLSHDDTINGWIPLLEKISRSKTRSEIVSMQTFVSLFRKAKSITSETTFEELQQHMLTFFRTQSPYLLPGTIESIEDPENFQAFMSNLTSDEYALRLLTLSRAHFLVLRNSMIHRIEISAEEREFLCSTQVMLPRDGLPSEKRPFQLIDFPTEFSEKHDFVISIKEKAKQRFPKLEITPFLLSAVQKTLQRAHPRSIDISDETYQALLTSLCCLFQQNKLRTLKGSMKIVFSKLLLLQFFIKMVIQQ